MAIELVGVPTGVKNEGGLLEFSTREVAVACLPKDIPPSIKADVNELKVASDAMDRGARDPNAFWWMSTDQNELAGPETASSLRFLTPVIQFNG